MRLSILYDLSYPFLKGGGQKRLFEIARRLVIMGYEVHWWALKAWPGADQTDVEGIRFHSVGPMTKLYTKSGRRTISEAAYYAAEVLAHRECLEADRVHCAVFPLLHLIPVLALVSERKFRLSVDWWEVWGDHWLEYLGAPGVIGRAVEAGIARRISNLVAISPEGVRQLRAIAGPSANIQLIHNGIDSTAIREARRVPDAAFDLAYIGRLKSHKNLDILIRALAMMKTLGTTATLELIGEGPERQNLEALSVTLGVRDQITFHGAIEHEAEAYSWLKAARLFVNPSTKEGGGSITIREANACGLPVVVFRHPLGVDPVLVEEGRNGFWVEEITAEGLGAKLSQLLTSDVPERLRQTCEQNASVYDWSNVATAYDDFFRRSTAGSAN
jgi:glycosyltransferase involved in cell wall biosynthesis